MKKQFFTNNSTDFPSELQCSSIRVNTPEQSRPSTQRRETNAHFQRVQPQEKDDRLKRYEENSLVGFEMSLEMDDDNRDYCWDLLHSKSVKEPPRPHPEPLAKSKEKTQYGNSLYNTSSFDEMTMKMSFPRSPNQPHLASQTHLPSDRHAAHLKPAEMHSYRELYSDHDLIVNVTREKDPSQQDRTSANSRTRTSTQTIQQQNQNFLQQLKCSMAESQHELSCAESSYMEPYFKTPVLTPMSEPKIEYDRNRLAAENQTYSLKKFSSLEGNRSQDKKLTLRDYLYLAQLSGQGRDKSPLPKPHLHPNEANVPSVTASRKKKQTSNEQVLGRIKSEISKNIKAMQSQLQEALMFVDRCDENAHNDQQEIMKMYNLSRIIKDQMMPSSLDLLRFVRTHDP